MLQCTQTEIGKGVWFGIVNKSLNKIFCAWKIAAYKVRRLLILSPSTIQPSRNTIPAQTLFFHIFYLSFIILYLFASATEKNDWCIVFHRMKSCCCLSSWKKYWIVCQCLTPASVESRISLDLTFDCWQKLLFLPPKFGHDANSLTVLTFATLLICSSTCFPFPSPFLSLPPSSTTPFPSSLLSIHPSTIRACSLLSPELGSGDLKMNRQLRDLYQGRDTFMNLCQVVSQAHLGAHGERCLTVSEEGREGFLGRWLVPELWKVRRILLGQVDGRGI